MTAIGDSSVFDCVHLMHSLGYLLESSKPKENVSSSGYNSSFAAFDHADANQG